MKNVLSKNKKQVNYKAIRRTKAAVEGIFRTVLLIGLSFIIVYPLIQSFIPSVTDYFVLGRPNSVWIPLKTSGMAYGVAITITNYWVSLGKSLLYSGILAVIQVVISAFVGYGFAKMKFKGSKILFGLVVLTIILPPQLMMLPQYLFFSSFKQFGDTGLLGKTITVYLLSFFGQGIKSGLFIYLFRQFFMGLPKELEEAAKVDGCSYNGIFFRIMLPNARPMLITIAVFSFVWNFGDMFYINQFANNAGLLPTSMIYGLTEQGVGRQFELLTGIPRDSMNKLFMGSIMGAMKVLFVFPLLLLYFIIQRKFVQSFERSGIVG